MTTIHFTEKILRSVISVIGFPLILLQFLLSKCTLLIHKPQGTMVNVGSHSLHVNVTGNSDDLPTVILESGLGGSALDWSLVQPQLSKHTKVVSYDRAGFGWSIQTIEKPTCENYVNDLREALVKLNLKPPYLLVGHSYGGMIMRWFASKYPDEVIGIVLVDSTHEKRFLESDSSECRTVEQMKHLSRLRLGYLLSPIAVPRVLKQHMGSRRLPLAIQKKVIALGYRNNAYKAAYHEYLCAFESAEQLCKSNALKPDMPVIVLSAGKQSEEWQAGQKELLELSNKTQHIIVEDSWHSIHICNPQAVVDPVIRLLYPGRDV